MKKIGLVIAIVCLIASSAFAATETATFDVYAGWNMVSVPLVPINPNPGGLTLLGGNPGVFDGVDLAFDGFLNRLDATTESGVDFDPFADPQPGALGNIVLGDGYWLSSTTGGTITFEGVPDGIPSNGTKTDVWISLPGNQNDGLDAGGWHLIGCPFNHEVVIDPNFDLTGSNVLFTDGAEVLNWLDAAGRGWVDLSASTFDAVSSSSPSVGIPDFGYDQGSFYPGKGYFIKTFKDNLAMIIKAN